MAHAPRNEILAAGVSRYSRTAIYKKKGMFKRKKTAVAAKPAEAPATTKTVPVKGAKNGKERVISLKKEARFYPAEDVAKPKATRKNPKTAVLRSAITPGTVLILLAGKFRGKRVVFLKQLPSGLLLVSGPFKLNGVPLKRVNQAYVIATSTKVDVSSVKIEENINDAYFKGSDEKKSKEFFAEKKEEKKTETSEEKKEAQKKVDTALLASISAVPGLSAYLKSEFSLKKGDAPHLMKF